MAEKNILKDVKGLINGFQILPIGRGQVKIRFLKSGTLFHETTLYNVKEEEIEEMRKYLLGYMEINRNPLEQWVFTLPELLELLRRYEN